MSTGIVATAIVLIIGYTIMSKILGLTFRLVVPLAVLALLGGAGVVSGLMPERSAADSYAPYRQAQHRPAADIGDLRLRDISDMAVDAVRSVLWGGLALLNGLSDPEPGREPHWPEEPEPTRHRGPMGLIPASPTIRAGTSHGPDGDRADPESRSDLPTDEP